MEQYCFVLNYSIIKLFCRQTLGLTQKFAVYSKLYVHENSTKHYTNQRLIFSELQKQKIQIIKWCFIKRERVNFVKIVSIFGRITSEIVGAIGVEHRKGLVEPKRFWRKQSVGSDTTD